MCLLSLWSVLWFCNGQHLVVVFWNLRKFYSFTKLHRLPLLNLINWILLLFYDPIRWINMKVNMVYWCIQRLNRAAPYASSTLQIHHCSVGNEKLAIYIFKINPLKSNWSAITSSFTLLITIPKFPLKNVITLSD